MLDLAQGQDARQDGATDTEFALAEIDRFVTGRRALHREMQTLLRVAVTGVIKQSNVRQDNCVYPEVDRSIHGLLPFGGASGLREGVDRHQHFAALGVGVTNAFNHGLLIEIQTGEVTGVGVVLETEVNRVGAVIDSRLERRQAAGWADEIGQGAHGGILKVKRRSIASAC